MKPQARDQTRPRPFRASPAPSNRRAVPIGANGGANGGAMRTLEKKNKELNSATRELEAKVKSLRQRSAGPAIQNGNRTLPKVSAWAVCVRWLLMQILFINNLSLQFIYKKALYQYNDQVQGSAISEKFGLRLGGLTKGSNSRLLARIVL